MILLCFFTILFPSVNAFSHSQTESRHHYQRPQRPQYINKKNQKTLHPSSFRRMKVEADAFLHSMPKDLQKRQTEAILHAIERKDDRKESRSDNRIDLENDSKNDMRENIDVEIVDDEDKVQFQEKNLETDLERVRSARRTSYTVPDDIQEVQLSPMLRLYSPKCMDKKVLPLLIYLHGGGWTIGGPESCARFAIAMAQTGKMRVVTVDYRLAPEHPFPEGLVDCMDAVKYLYVHKDDLNVSHITVGGDSSGGILALACGLSSSCRSYIHSLLLFYPVTLAYDDHSKSWQKYGSGYALDAGLMKAFNKAYVCDTQPQNLQVSMGLLPSDSLQKLPPTLMISAQRDILFCQGRLLAKRVPEIVRQVVFRGSVHLFITVPGQNEAFIQAVNLSSAFISED